MTTIHPGDYWLAEIWFTDGSAAKKRPVLILWLDGKDVVVAAVTSSTPRSASDVSLNDWRVSGLRVQSTVRLSRLDCLEQSVLLFQLGHVSTDDAHVIKETWSNHIRLRF